MVKTLWRLLALFLSVSGAALGWQQYSLFPARRRRQQQQPQSVMARPQATSAASPLDLTGPSGDGSSFSSSFSSPRDKNDIDWIVYVDHSKNSLEKGAAATLDAFLGLAAPAPPLRSSRIQVKAAILPKQAKSGNGQQPWVRCVNIKEGSALEVSGVDSVDKVYRVLTKHMKLEGISRRACNCLQYKYKANGFLEAGKVSLAIEAYQKAFAAATGDKQQQGVILFLRAAAYLQRAAQHRDELKDIVEELTNMVPSPPTLVSLLDVAYYAPTLSSAVLRRILKDSERQEQNFRSTQCRHGLYQYALLQAAQDALKATEVLSNYAPAYVRAADIMGELWKLPEAVLYYERAMALDPSLQPTLLPVIARLQRRQELLAEARSYRWSEDTLRLALDVAG